MTVTTDYVPVLDSRAQRIQAQAEADQTRAATEATRLETEHRRHQMRLDRDRAEAEDRRQAERDRREAKLFGQQRRRDQRAAAMRSIGTALPDVARAVACVAPTAIATRGQLGFARDVMRLGVMSPLLPMMLEGAAWSLAWRRHQALHAGEPTGRLTIGVWSLALVAAAMNFWHGSTQGTQVGVAYALSSLVGFALVELLAGHTRGARNGIKQRAWLLWGLRAVRYPALTCSAWSLHIAMGPGVDAERAWRQVWRDRYDCEPGSTARMRDHGRRRVQADRAAAPLTATEASTEISPSTPPARPTRTRKGKTKTATRTDGQLLDEIREWATQNGRLPGRNETCRLFGIGDTRAGRLLREVRVAA